MENNVNFLLLIVVFVICCFCQPCFYLFFFLTLFYEKNMFKSIKIMGLWFCLVVSFEFMSIRDY